jgi:hypothetical protein
VVFIACGVGLLAGPPPAQAGFVTSFEPPAYVLGPLAGQDGWQDVYATSAGTVTDTQPRTGAQAVLIDGGLAVVVGGGFSIATYQRDFGLTPAAGGQRVQVRADIRLDGPSTATGDPVGDDLLSANLNVNNGDGFFLASWIVSSGGNAFAFGSPNEPYLFSVPINLGESNTFALDLDYANFRTDFVFNGAVVLSSPFDPAFDRTTLGNVQLEVFTALGQPAAAAYQARFDNVAVSTVPEPSSLVLLATAGLWGCLRLRRRAVPSAEPGAAPDRRGR